MDRLIFLSLVLILGCADKPASEGGDDTQDTVPAEPVDEDGDGFFTDEDCDDRNEEVNPSGVEICDGIDNNCDSVVDEGVTSVYYADADGDGYGDPNSTTYTCSRPEGYVPVPNDCDDADASVWPGAAELCDGKDQDCDEEIDEGVTSLYYVDADGDGYGDPGQTTPSCEGLPGSSDDPTDCDDADPLEHPGAEEHCDGEDDDCDGLTDEEPTVEGGLWYPDADGDGYGDPGGEPSVICVQPAGYTSDTSDCDDRDDAISPEAPEVCSNEADDDCDGDIDEGCPIEHCGRITADETWSADHEHIVTCDVIVGGSDSPVLIIEDGVQVTFVIGTGLYIATVSPGRLEVDGGALGVLFTSESDTPIPGDWTELRIGYYDEGSTLTGFTMEGGGGGEYGSILAYGSYPTFSDCAVTGSASAGIYGRVGSGLTLSGCALTDNASDGLTLEESSELLGFDAVTMTGNGGFPISIPANSLRFLGLDSTFTGNGDDRVQVLEDKVTATATWSDLGVPYYVAGNIEIEGSSTPSVAVEDGVVFQFAGGVGLTVGSSGKGILDVRGETEGVLFTAADDDDPGEWDGLSFGAFDEGSSLTLAEVRYGGANGYGGVYLNGANVEIDTCTITENDGAGIYARNGAEPEIADTSITNNDGYGLYVHTDAGLAAGAGASFEDNTVSGNEEEGVVVPAGAVGELDDSSTYSGNDVPGVRVLSGTIEDDTTWQVLDEDYVVAGDIEVEDSAEPILTLSAGLTLAFEPAAGLLVGVGGHGALAVVGTRSKPVTLTSASSAPEGGDWDGVTFGDRCDASDVLLSYVTVSYGGGNGYGNLYFDECDGTVSNATISYSSAWGIYRASASPTLTSITYTSNASGTVY